MIQNFVQNVHNVLLFLRLPPCVELLRIKRCFQTCDVAELYLLVAFRSSTRGQGLTFTSASVLA